MSILKGEQAKVPTLFGTTTIPSAARSRSGYLSRPDLGGQWPTVLVMSGAGPITSPVKEVCRRLARQGFAVLAPEIDDLEKDLDVVVPFVAGPNADWSSAEFGFGFLGLQEGGGDAVAASGRRPSTRALALVSHAPDPEALGAIGIPLLGLSGRDDEAVPPEAVAAAREAAPQAEWVVYNGLGGDWWNDHAEGWDDEAAADTVERLAAFFGRHLPELIP